MGFGGGPSIPPAPEVQKTANFESSVSGVRRRVVEGPDGRETIIEERMPLSPEEQALEAELAKIRDENLKRIEELSGVASAMDIPEFQETIEAFKRTQERGLSEAQDFVTERSEEALARRGLEDSTAGIQQRDVRDRGFIEQRAAAADQARLLGEDLRSQAINRAQNMFGIATGRQDVQFAQMANSLARGQSGAIGQTQMMNTANQQAFQNQLKVSELQAQSKQAGLGNLTALAGIGATLATGGLGGAGFSLFGGMGAGGFGPGKGKQVYKQQIGPR